MQELPVLAAVIGPVLAFMVLRFRASIVFLSLCFGVVLSQFVDAANLADQLAPFTGHTSENTIRYALLLVPSAVAMLLTVRSAHRGVRGILSMLIAASAGVLALVSILPLLSLDAETTVRSGQVWHYVYQYKTIIIAAGGTLSLLQALSRKHHKPEHLKNGKRHE